MFGFDTDLLIQATYLVTAALFILGLKRMSSPVTARSGILWAGAGMLVATLITFLAPGIDTTNYWLILAAIAVGGVLAWVSGKRVAMTDMPQMIALYNGMGGGAAAALAAVELNRITMPRTLAEATTDSATVLVHEGTATITLAVVGGLIGAISFSGSAIALESCRGSSRSPSGSRGSRSSTSSFSSRRWCWVGWWRCSSTPRP
jgi:H+-translocating NAD(P) transhydrogenase subunit beta